MAQQSESILGAHTGPEITSASQAPQVYTYYHAGPLFTIGDLTTNVRLSKAIHDFSKQKYQPILPQDLEQRDTSPHSIRDEDIKALLSCDLALFTYDGCELDSGTVVEYMIAKFADIPTVILRSDFRGGGDQASHQGEPWNLMSSFWPRSVGVVVNGMMEYKAGLAKALAGSSEDQQNQIGWLNSTASETIVQTTASKVVAAFDKVLTKPSQLPKELRPAIYQWLALMPNFKTGSNEQNTQFFLNLLQSKEQKLLY